jgi:hypothetical protein
MCAVVLLAVVCPATNRPENAQQIPFNFGQNVVPVYEGWERNPDGSVAMIFGYFNRNYREELSVPVGADNEIQPGGPDRGQPTFFYPRRQEFQFRVPVPKDWGNKDVIWTLTVRGKTEKAFGSLLPMYEVDRQLIAKNIGSGGFGLRWLPRMTTDNQNRSPSTVITLLNAVTLRATVSDDRIPKAVSRRPRERQRGSGLDQRSTGAGRTASASRAVSDVGSIPRPRQGDVRAQRISGGDQRRNGHGERALQPAGHVRAARRRVRFAAAVEAGRHRDGDRSEVSALTRSFARLWRSSRNFGRHPRRRPRVPCPPGRSFIDDPSNLGVAAVALADPAWHRLKVLPAWARLPAS